jgi:Tol biopolymer transport system component
MIVALIGSVASATVAETATPFPGKNGGIAYMNVGEGSSAIWVMSSTGAHQRMLIDRGAHSPVWSPGGNKIIFIRDEQLYVINADGTGRKNLTQEPRFTHSSPVWSPDGRQIAFVRSLKGDDSWRSAIFTVTLNGSREKNISGWSKIEGYRAPSWSPDGSRLVYEQFDKGSNSARLLVKNIKTDRVREVTKLSDVTTSSNVSWSPNGKKILYNDSDGQVYTIWPDGSHRTVISDGESYGASWSADGKKIAFLEDFDGENISISEEDGTVVWIPIDKGEYEDVGFPSWSPEGDKLIFTMAKGVGSERVSDLFSLGIKSGTATPSRLATGTLSEPSWQAK